tara:strand:+ start:134581 stop:136116 length:1536 start_codon:yes stop_codon:yes gene_type:complete
MPSNNCLPTSTPYLQLQNCDGFDASFDAENQIATFTKTAESFSLQRYQAGSPVLLLKYQGKHIGFTPQDLMHHPEWKQDDRMLNGISIPQIKACATAVKAACNHSSTRYWRDSHWHAQLLREFSVMAPNTSCSLLPRGDRVPSIVLIILAGFSSLTTAAVPASLWIVILSMIGSGLFNFIGGKEFEGWHCTPRSFLPSTWGFVSAIAPAVLTYYGGVQLNSPMVVTIIAVISNFILSGSLGANGLSGIFQQLKQDYHAYGSVPVLREFRLFIYVLLAFSLSLGRTDSVVQFAMDRGWVENVSRAYGIAAFINIPECLMFLRAVQGFYKKIYDAVASRDILPKTTSRWLATIFAVLIGLSFSYVFYQLNEMAFEERLNQYWGLNCPALVTFLSASSGICAFTLVGGEAKTLADTLAYLSGFFRYMASSVGQMGLSCLGQVRDCVMSSSSGEGDALLSNDSRGGDKDTVVTIDETDVPRPSSLIPESVQVSGVDYTLFHSQAYSTNHTIVTID